MDDHGAKFLEWVNSTSVGCHFARMLAADVEAAKWDGATIRGNSLDQEAVSVLNALFTEACGKLEAVHALFPDINTPADVVGLIQALCATPSWKCVEIKVECPHASEQLLVGLRWFLPDKKHVNYVLGFGKFEPMPKTRQAPFTALVLRCGPPGAVPGIAHAQGAAPPDIRSPDMDRIPVHLADMPYSLPSEERIACMWRKTGELKGQQLDGDDMAKAAKAKITFCLPPEMRRALAGSLTEIVALLASAAAM